MTYVRTEKINDKYKYIHKLECKQCNTGYETVRGNRSPINQGWCSEECRREWHRLNRRMSTCKQCNSNYWKVSETKLFCDNTCYHQHMKENPEQYGLIEKAQKARTNANTSTSIQKMLDTRLARGLMIDWTDASWKQYWKKCDQLTRKMRTIMLEGWDGLDYITGDFIKPNMQLHHSHGDYPTLDHIIPKSECYKRGLTPEEACSADNLRWTTRRNNSSKYNKII